MDEPTVSSDHHGRADDPRRRTIGWIAALVGVVAVIAGILVGNQLATSASPDTPTESIDLASAKSDTSTDDEPDDTTDTTADPPDEAEETTTTTTTSPPPSSPPPPPPPPSTTSSSTTSSTTASTTTTEPPPQLSFPTLVNFGSEEFETITIANTGTVTVAWSPGPADEGVTYYSPGGTLEPGESAQLTIGVSGPTNQAFTKAASVQYGGDAHPITLRRRILTIAPP